MVQDHFLLHAANQAIVDESVRAFLKQYEGLLNHWPWQDTAAQWVDHLLSFAAKPEMMQVFLDPMSQGGGKLYCRVDGRVLPGPEFTVEQYNQLLTAIQARIVCSQSLVGPLLQEGYLLTKAEQKYWVGVLQTVAGVQITLNLESNELPNEPFDGWPAQAREVVEQMQKHPNGLMLFCHRGWSLNRKDAIFRVFDSCIRRSNGARIGCVIESLQTLLPYDNITQLCIDGSLESWEQASRALVAQDIDVVLMRGRNEKDVVTQAIYTALEDRCVLVDVSHFNVVDTLLWLVSELPVTPNHLASVLLGIVGGYPGLRKTCPYCRIEREPNNKLFKRLEEWGISFSSDGNWMEGQGCSECHGTGYIPRQRLTLVEAAYVDQSLASLLISHPSKDQLYSAICESGFQTYFGQAFQFAQQGMTTLQEAIRVGLARRSEL